jgi:dihydropyrimidine dehydrogenase (NAD+) subunit PreT
VSAGPSGHPQPVARNLRQFPELHPPLSTQSALAEANRCLFCFDAPCTAACPTHIDVPRFIKKIASDNLRGSALAILDANILGLSCSRVCPVDVLCEGSCVLHRYNKKPIEIGRLQRFAMDRFYDSGARPGFAAITAPRMGRVACIGGGPASLACAAELRRQGHGVTIYDNRSLPGGLNTYGVADYKLRPSDSLREVEFVRSLGVEFRQAEVGAGVSVEDLESEYDLLFIGIGLGAMERLNIPGEDLPGVIDALRFIERYKTAEEFSVTGSVVVIGGGNTAIDAANAAKRLGAREVHVVYRRTERQMPAFSFEYHHSKVEGVRFHWLAQPVEIIARNGAPFGPAAAVKFIETRLAGTDESGRHKAIPVPGSYLELPCDLVIPALGQSHFLGTLCESRGIRLAGRSIAVDRPTGQTSNPRYYAGGDCVNGGREVVDAVADGKRAALAMAKHIECAAEAPHG